ncbi:asparagine synthetase [glutamine-hydrolyzing] 1 [Clostridium homopropionicum DSM 5847]|uniref:asparagine synthase (glutamine-hydrolyzing) n=1 Tax=Clostridium homopropionicum DSM 5847 TaxID=1121318 RepID=A0A0L6ZDZ2_9CLOT|nr:asparagine synthase (glutamine-hydrolyzing) [Clostridium homopropionicum]KOA21033.1 asparagine synthetase [glutamine-hydrolyzing] 1 [Clostridium homopropionicum DSM 5847]SFF98927.1 asparagine synthase (glutamine-hydrolysing) [Clostridium homopropionicum]
MCGIVGMLNFDKKPILEKMLKKMTNLLAHRGPDDENIYISKYIGLGHRRLSIIDLSSLGRQPMTSDDGRYTITYNGEIYNFNELRRILEKKGHKFNTKTDTEVVLKCYEIWGHQCVQYFNGMFAFAIWDNLNKELFLARDRYGIKPLYYAFINNTFVFASEQKAIIGYESFKKDLDLECLLEYFTFQNIFTDKTFFKGIKLFPQGSWSVISVNDKIDKLNLVKYWDFNFVEENTNGKDEEYIEELNRLIKQSVKRQLVADVGIGSYLSGGIDSGAITSIAATLLPYIKTFTCGFDLTSASGLELGFDEREKAEYMSYLFKTEHYEMILKAGDMERILNKLVYHVEEPRVGQSYPNFYAAQLASKFVKVVLSGTGGDELFGGYPWRYYKAAVNDNFEDYIDKYYLFWQRLIPNKEIRNVFSPIWNSVKHVWTRDIFKDVFQNNQPLLMTPKDYINSSMYFEAKTFLHGLLVIEDKISMANGLETRVPLLDNDLVDFAMKLPVELKLKNFSETIRINENEIGSKTEKYFSNTKDGKLIFRKTMDKLMPQDILNGKKQGFSAPDASWFRGESIEFVRKKILNKSARIYEYLDFGAVSKLIYEHLEGKNNRRLLIWSLLNFEIWCDNFL